MAFDQLAPGQMTHRRRKAYWHLVFARVAAAFYHRQVGDARRRRLERRQGERTLRHRADRNGDVIDLKNIRTINKLKCLSPASLSTQVFRNTLAYRNH
jgi:hypothetical protein